jgi:beta-xylosidase
MVSFSNPILPSDWSDPDVIRVGSDFFMVSSSFNYCPGIPILHSKDLVHWELINYVIRDFPAASFHQVRPGCGAWAPSLRWHQGVFYCLIPFPDEGIFVAETKDIYGEWSDLRCLLPGSGFEDPCPIWIGEKTYVVFAFVKSRIGFNSKLGLIETDAKLSVQHGTGYQIIYDGTVDNPRIEGPKCYLSEGKVLILAPAGGVEHGWEEALIADSVFGPYQVKRVLQEKDGCWINGPHQGALVDLDDKGNYAFVHFCSQGNLGRIICLEPAVFSAGWPLLGNKGTPVLKGNIPLAEHKCRIDYSDSFSGSLSAIWQTPCQIDKNSWLSSDSSGLRMKAMELKEKSLSLFPYVLSERICDYSFSCQVQLDVSHLGEGAKAGLGIAGRDSAFIFVINRQSKSIINLYSESNGGSIDEDLCEVPQGKIILSLDFAFPDTVSFSVNGRRYEFKVCKEQWVGLRVGLTAIGYAGWAVFSSFKVTPKKPHFAEKP